MTMRKLLIQVGAIGGGIWGTSMFIGAIASAPVTAPIAAASGAILAGSVMLGASAKR